MRSALEWAQVKAMAVDGVSQRQIAAMLGINRRTVRRLLQAEAPPSYRRVSSGSKVDRFEPILRRVLEEWPEIKAPRMTEILREHGYDGSVDVVKRRLRELRLPVGRPAQRTGYRPGQVLQLDWAELPTRPRIAGRERRIYALIGSLPYSGAQSAHFSFDMTLESFLEGHVRLLDWLGGVTRECVYDNLRSVVAKRDGEEVRWNARFLHLRGHYAFHATVCTPATPREKGSVEGAVRYLKGGFWPARRIVSLADLDEQYADWRDRVCNRRLHATGRFPVAERLAEERRALRPLPPHSFDFGYARESRVPLDGYLLSRVVLSRAGGARSPACRVARRAGPGVDPTSRPGGRPLPARLRARRLASGAKDAPRATISDRSPGDRAAGDRAAGARRLRGVVRMSKTQEAR